MTTEAWVVNASPLILFSRIGRLDLIERLAPSIVVPETVINEIRSGAHKDKAADVAVAWAMRFRRPDIALPTSVACWNLGPGESQVIGYCIQASRWAVLDDLMARRCVHSLGLLMIGSLGITLRAKKHGLIKTARPVIDRLVDEGMFAGRALLERLLAEIGEGR